GRRGRGAWQGRGEYGEAYEAPYRAGFHGYGMGYSGGALRSRGSFQAGQLRSGQNPADEFEFQWGEGYVGGRGYGGTNYDYEHGYLTGGTPRYGYRPPDQVPPPRRESSPATRGGYSWSEELASQARHGGELHGPARYGYGPYYERLQRQRRSDEEIRADVEEALFYDTWVDADRIEVSVENGIVTLRGTLPNYDEIRYATDDAWDVDGVRGVRTELKVSREERAEAGGAPGGAAAGERGGVGGDRGEQSAAATTEGGRRAGEEGGGEEAEGLRAEAAGGGTARVGASRGGAARRATARRDAPRGRSATGEAAGEGEEEEREEA